MRGSDRLPVVIVGGLHSDARKEVVDRLLRTVPGSVALHHDLATATEGAVRRLVRDASGELSRGRAPLVDDCACCALREDLVPELERLAADGQTRLAVVELWDSVEPRAMAEAVVAHGGDALELTNVMTAVDPALVMPCLGNGDDLAEAGLAAAATDRRTVGDTWARQLEYAPVLVLVDSDAADDEDRALLAQLHPTARQVSSGSDELVLLAFAGFDVESAAAAQHPACALLPQEADEAGVATLVWHHHRPFHPERLFQALEELCCAAARSRGRFWLADRPDTLLAWDAAGGALCVESAGPWLASLPDAAWDMVPPVRRAAAALDWHPEHGDRCQHLVFTSPGLDREGLARLLDSCLLTDTEYAAGTEAWRRLPAPFDSFLDPAH
ncbi:cobalamin biosynthesis protein CobW [Streptomyces gelaticus]|uniref:Cobalamin biosynthesis protein CobW n=1 Tax=Streptomyces gelaticus TaxID=285446 RepID=A0ABQ2VPL9_9ACTN|nr:GTP-binding protein [Streptomyces gelaticus]GGV73223.1 cobalamin biosynthesis protein CobW [Streptomyces gelaticus]